MRSRCCWTATRCARPSTNGTGSTPASLTSHARARLSGPFLLASAQKVYVDGSLVLGEGAGEGTLNECFEYKHVSNVTVCGTHIKLTAYADPGCLESITRRAVYLPAPKQEVGSCNADHPANACEFVDLAAYEAEYGEDEYAVKFSSFMITPCPVAVSHTGSEAGGLAERGRRG